MLWTSSVAVIAVELYIIITISLKQLTLYQIQKLFYSSQKPKISDLNILLHIEFKAYVKWPWDSFLDVHVIYWWSTFPSYHLKYGKYISLPAQDTHLDKIYFKGIPRTEPLTLVWMKDNYIRHGTLSELKSDKCLINDKWLRCNKIKVN